MPTEKSNWREAATAEYAARRADLLKQRTQCAARIDAARKKMNDLDREIDELDHGARVFGLPVEGPQPDLLIPDENGRMMAVHFKRSVPGRQFKDVALEYLQRAYPAAMKAAEVQSMAEADLGRPFHWKTAGMTLYRLKQEHLVRREGQSWFFVPPEERIAEIRREQERGRMAFQGDPLGDDEEQEPIG